MASFVQTASGSANDATERNANTNFSSTGTTNAAKNAADGTDSICGVRFTALTIPQGARIDSATLELWVDKADDPGCDLYAEAVDDAVDFSTNADVALRSRSTATVAWDATNIGTGAYKSSPDIRSIIQEQVNRSGWVSGNDLVLLVKGRSSGTASIDWRTCDHASAGTQAPKLTVNYTIETGNFFPFLGVN